MGLFLDEPALAYEFTTAEQSELAAQPLPDISLELRLPAGAHVGPAAGHIPGPQQGYTFYDLQYDC